MGQEAAPDPAEVPLGDGLADIPEGDPEDAPADDDDDQGLRWAALLAAFIDDALGPGPRTAPPDAPAAEPPAPGEA